MSSLKHILRSAEASIISNVMFREAAVEEHNPEKTNSITKVRLYLCPTFAGCDNDEQFDNEQNCLSIQKWMWVSACVRMCVCASQTAAWEHFDWD